MLKKFNQKNLLKFPKFQKCSQELTTQNDSESIIHQSVLITGNLIINLFLITIMIKREYSFLKNLNVL